MSDTQVPWHALVKLTGETGAVKLCAEFGGTRIVLPMRVRATHPVAQLAGAEAMKRLIDSYGAGSIMLPQGPDRGPGGRRRRVEQYLAQGFSTAEAARLADVHQRTARRVSVRRKASQAELPLFRAGQLSD